MNYRLWNERFRAQVFLPGGSPFFKVTHSEAQYGSSLSIISCAHWTGLLCIEATHLEGQRTARAEDAFPTATAVAHFHLWEEEAASSQSGYHRL